MIIQQGNNTEALIRNSAKTPYSLEIDSEAFDPGSEEQCLNIGTRLQIRNHKQSIVSFLQVLKRVRNLSDTQLRLFRLAEGKRSEDFFDIF